VADLLLHISIPAHGNNKAGIQHTQGGHVAKKVCRSDSMDRQGDSEKLRSPKMDAATRYS
jgi:hypothetical protein